MAYIRKDSHGYYHLVEKTNGKEHQIKYIGNEDELRIFKRNLSAGKEAIAHLKKRPYLATKACLSIIAEGKKAEIIKTPEPDKKYKTIVIDPPWPMEKILRDERPNQHEFDYPTMSLDEIRKLPVNRIAEQSGSHIYLWTTQKYLPSAFEIFNDWGVDYQCLMTWIKNVGFTPFSFMYSTEHCLFGRYGTLSLLKLGKRLDFTAKVREHSRKPDEFYELVKEVSPEPRLDWFSREPRNGFEQYGNEPNKFESNNI